MTDVVDVDVLAEIRVVAAGVSTAQYLAGTWPPDSQLVDGEVLVTDPRFRHQHIALWFASHLFLYVESQPQRGLVGFGANWRAPVEGHVYKPDVWWLSEDRRHLTDDAYADGLPDLAIEVRSPGTWSIDIGRKRDVYEQGETSELWLVDIPADRVLVDRRSPETGRFERIAELAPPAVLTTDLLPGLELDLAAAFDR